MSYARRNYRHRNPHDQQQEQQQPGQTFFNQGGQHAVQTKEDPSFFQPKLTVGEPDDQYEKEADSVANTVVNNANAPAVQQKKISSIQKLATGKQEEKLSTDEERMKRDKEVQTKPDIQQKCAECEKEEKEGAAQAKKDEAPVKEEEDKLKGATQMKEDEPVREEEDKKKNPVQTKPAGTGGTASAQVSSRIEQSSGKGRTMPDKTLSHMQSSFGRDFSNVNIHTDQESASLNRDLGAQAFTHGNDIYFNSGKYNPESSDGQRLLAHELTHVVQQGGSNGTVNRKMSVPFSNRPPLNSKNPAAKKQGETVQSLLNQLCGEGGITVAGGNVQVPSGLCTAANPTTGKTKAQESKTKTGCTCLCDMDVSPHSYKIVLDDDVRGTTQADGPGAEQPGVGSGATVTLGSPDAPPITHPGQSGKDVDTPTLIILGHELCGHAWLFSRGEAGKDDNAERGRGGHQETIERENMIRDEQGMGRRATFRQPFCGEDPEGHASLMEECKEWRRDYNRINGTNFKLEDNIPVKPGEKKPADFTMEVFFNKDMPQSWFNPAASFNVSVTPSGKEFFNWAVGELQNHPDKKFQLEAHASSEKPADKPDYNTKLSERRVRLVLQELIKRGIDAKRLATKEDSACDKLQDGIKNCSDTEAGKPNTETDRKVVIRIF